MINYITISGALTCDGWQPTNGRGAGIPRMSHMAALVLAIMPCRAGVAKPLGSSLGGVLNPGCHFGGQFATVQVSDVAVEAHVLANVYAL
jgi:hypothetical protein